MECLGGERERASEVRCLPQFHSSFFLRQDLLLNISSKDLLILALGFYQGHCVWNLCGCWEYKLRFWYLYDRQLID